jgi:hypothetical protein
MHNHFVVKSLDLTRPGGLVAVVTLRFTFNAASETARVEMATRADLVGAVRPAARTFRACADTDVIADVVVLPRRDPGLPAWGPNWRSVVTVETEDSPMQINEYFAARPAMIAGRLGLGGSQYNAADLTVTPDPARTAEVCLAGVVADAVRAELAYQPAGPVLPGR